VLDPAKVALGDDAEDRERPPNSANEVVSGDDDGGRDDHVPVLVEREEGERAEDVKVGFEPAAGEVDQQGGPHHLCHRDDMAGERRAWHQLGEHDGHAGEHAAE
jgi:hypothetical protein